MDQIDEFESIFRRAEREPFGHADVPLKSVALVTDTDRNRAEALMTELQTFCPALRSVDTWRPIVDGDYANVGELLERVNAEQTDLVVTYRHLHEEALVPQHSLGVYLDVLTQATSIPVLVLPGTAVHPVSLAERKCEKVMVVTDHISGDNRLVNYGVKFSPPDGTMWLCHVEDNAVFARYMRAIERIPEIDTDQAQRLLSQELLREARGFIETCVKELKKKVPALTVQSHVTRGHYLREYQELIENDGIDLVVANTKKDDQLAMHGMAYSLSVELVDVAMLLL